MDDRELLSRITINPDTCNGRPILCGTRITVDTILEFLRAGESRDEILRQYPVLQAVDIDAAIVFADP
jgi:uncharacterized protein (DUF433 family)